MPGNRLNDAALADLELIEGGHDRPPSGQDGADQDAHEVVAPQAQATAADLQHARATRLQHLELFRAHRIGLRESQTRISGALGNACLRSVVY